MSGPVTLSLACMAIGLFISDLFAQQLSRPIRLLNRVTQQVAEGHLTVRAEIDTGDEPQYWGEL